MCELVCPNKCIMETSTSAKFEVPQGSGAMPASAQKNGRNSDATPGKKKIRNFYLGENGLWKLRSEMLSYSDLEQYSKKIIWDESVSLMEDETFARHLLESLAEDLGYRDKFASCEGGKKTKKVELHTMFPHEAERWETLRNRMVCLRYFDRYLLQNPDWSLDELFSSCLMDQLEELLNNSDDWQNCNNTPLEKDISRDDAIVAKSQEDGDDDNNNGGVDGDDNDDEDWVYDIVDGDGEDNVDADWVGEEKVGDGEGDTNVSSDDDPAESNWEPRHCRKKRRRIARPVIQQSSDSDETEETVMEEKTVIEEEIVMEEKTVIEEVEEEEMVIEEETVMEEETVIEEEETVMEEKTVMEEVIVIGEEKEVEEETVMEEKTVMESKQTMYECKFCREVFRTRFLVTQHYTTKHQRHVYRSMSTQCATVLRRCEVCDSFVAGLKLHRLEKHQVCEKCGRIYGTVEKLRRHTESHTNPESDLVRPKRKVYECKICKLNFGTERHVTKHFSTKHKTNSLSQKTGTVLQQPMKVGECATVLWYCKDCDSYVAELKSHRREKHRDCAEACGKTVAPKVHPPRGTVVHTKTEPKRKCLQLHYCGNRFQTRRHFNYHIKRHLGEVLNMSHKCDVCCQYFWTRRNLAFHKRIHSSDKTFLCTFCGLLFFLKDDAKKHMCALTGDEPCNV